MPWIDPFDAFDYGNECVQFNFETERVFGDENCLYLNVFVPARAIEAKNQSKLAVIVYIPGESFQSGSSNDYGPDFLLEKDVIVVSCCFQSIFHIVFFLLSFFSFYLNRVFLWRFYGKYKILMLLQIIRHKHHFS